VSVKVKISRHLQRFTNDLKVTETDGSTVGECLNHLVEEFPALKERFFDTNGNLFRYYRIYVNKKSIHSDGLVKPIKEGDELSIIRMVGGG